MRHHAGRRQWYADHPKSLWIREDDILVLVSDFFAEHISGPYRQTALRSVMRVADAEPPAASRLRSALADLDKRKNNLLTQVEEFEPTGDDELDRDFRDRLRHRYAEIASQHKAKAAELKMITTRVGIPQDDPSLLDELPGLPAELTALPEDQQREFFDSFNLELRYRFAQHDILIRVTIKEDAMPTISALANEIADPPEGGSANQNRSLVLGAPCEAPTTRERPSTPSDQELFSSDDLRGGGSGGRQVVLEVRRPLPRPRGGTGARGQARTSKATR